MEVSVLASGSSGNSTFIESKENCLLVDAGISSKAAIKRLSEIGKEISDVKAIFITHEHSDHITGVERLNRKFGIPVFLNRTTYEFSSLNLENPNFFKNGEQISLEDLQITPFSTSHDAADPCGFKIKDSSKTIGVITDFGKVNQEIKELTKEADALVLETNHDIDMLINGPYPEHLKHRILSDKGHLSNADAGILVKNNASERLKTVFLAHLSKNNNTEELAINTFKKLTEKNRKLRNILTKQEKNTELIRI